MLDFQPTLENEMLILRPLRKEDFESLFRVAKDPLIWEQHPISTRYKKEVFTDFFIESINSQGALLAIEKSTGQVIGSSRFKPIKDSNSAIEIGWSFLAREKWGKGYNRSMKKLMIDYALERKEHIIFYIGIENIRSQKAVEKIGGKRIVGHRYQHLIKKSENDLTYRIGRLEWKVKAH